MAETATEEFGVALGVHSVHPEQGLLPFALHTQDTSAHKGRPQPNDERIILLLDLSGSMRTGSPSGIDGLLETLDSLPKFFAEHTTTSKLTILGFSASCGGLQHNHSLRGKAATQPTSVETQNPTELAAYCRQWAEKCERVSLPATHRLRECGGETNYEAALRAATHELNNYDAGKKSVYMCTDGAANAGLIAKVELRRLVNTEVLRVGHFNLHALMIGPGAQPGLLSGVLNGRGVLGYASTNDDLANGMLEVLEKTLKQDSIEAVVFAAGKMTICSLGTRAKQGILVAKLPVLEENAKELSVEIFHGVNTGMCAAWSTDEMREGLLESANKGECKYDKFVVAIDTKGGFWLPEDYQKKGRFTASDGAEVRLQNRVRVKEGLFERVYAKAAFAESCEEALSASQSHEEAANIARRLGRRAKEEGHHELARRCDSVRKESEEAQHTPGPERSASHLCVSQFSIA